MRNVFLSGLLVAVLVAVSNSACGHSDPPSPHPGTDASAALDVYPTDFIAENTPMKLLAEGDDVQLVQAPQGGHVIHIGARVRGLASEYVNIRARIRDANTNAIQTEEARDVLMQAAPDDPDLKENDLRSVSQLTHIPACPDYDAVDIVDRPWTLEVIVRELYGPGQGSATLGIVLRCLQTDPAANAECRCECAKNYVLGKCADAGIQDASAGD